MPSDCSLKTTGGAYGQGSALASISEAFGNEVDPASSWGDRAPSANRNCTQTASITPKHARVPASLCAGPSMRQPFLSADSQVSEIPRVLPGLRQADA